MSRYPTAFMSGNQLIFLELDGFARACAHGVFYLQEPEDINFLHGERLAQSFYHDQSIDESDPYRGFKQRPLSLSALGYSSPSTDQVELLQLEAKLWYKYLPTEVAKDLWRMNALSVQILTALMGYLQLTVSDMATIARGIETDDALQYCIFNHYRSARENAIGFTAHKDSGFITTLYTKTSGLECYESGEWFDIAPSPGCLTIVLGHAFEVLTERLPTRVLANYHRVRNSNPVSKGLNDRHSYGVYIGPRFDQDLYQYSPSGALERHSSFLEFQKRKASEMSFEFHPRVDVEAEAEND